VQVGSYQGLSYLWLCVLRWKIQLACPPVLWPGMEIQGGVDGLALLSWPNKPLGLLYASLSVPRKGRYLSPSTWWIWCFCVCCLGDAGNHSILLVQEGVGSITEPIYGLQSRIPLHMNSQWRNWHLHGHCVPFVPGIGWWISSTRKRKKEK
jgi:hypothetical protein